ncbi:MAG TPA: aldo/keto reductase [Kofleriaceae bacterium]|nr:aldo/keto reductase [Kofleriaceae bacterium]
MTTTLDRYRLLGRSGLRVSPLSLGTMTFGTDWGWGADEHDARRMFDAYVAAGGNFIDGANAYTGGTAEKMLGAFAEGRRDRLVIATKYTATMDPTDPNSGGNHRKSLVRSVEGSLARLRTDYLDLLYLHAWDGTTPVDEIARALDDLVRAGKLLHVGMSNVPAWQIARLQTLADLRGTTPVTALQIEYNLIERGAERELLPMAKELGLAVVPWSPLASGVLAGKYSERDLEAGSGVAEAAGTRKNVAAAQGSLHRRGLAIAGVVKEVAAELRAAPAQVALAWVLAQPGVTSPIIGARSLAQLEDNLGALALTLSHEHLARLAAASALELGYPHDMLARPMTRAVMFGTALVEGLNA